MLRAYKIVETRHKELHDNIIAFFDRIEFETGAYNSNFFGNDFYNQIVSHHKTILEKPLRQIFELISKWPQNKRSGFCTRIKESNDIHRICKRELAPLRLNDIDGQITAVVDIKKLFSDLYKQVLYGKHCEAIYGSMQEHFKLFKNDENDIFKCPVCGLLPQNTKEEKKEDYDHLLPYTIYPFSSINFNNLAPICVDCNSDYKEDKDVLNNTGKKLFYYYDDTHQGISIEAKLIDEINYAFSFTYKTTDDRNEEIQSWDEIFGINDRYEKRAKGKARNWFRIYWEFLEKPKYNAVDIAAKKGMYFDILREDQDIEVIKIPVIEAMENSPMLSKAFQESAKYKMKF